MSTTSALGSAARSALRVTSWRIADICERRAATPLPPRRLVYLADAGDYESVGRAFFPTLVEYGLDPHDDVLELCSGIGRLARLIGPYLSSGRYLGVDTWKEGVEWCEHALASRAANLSFVHLLDRDPRFQPEGVQPPAPLPVASATFDVALSVAIRHLDAARIRHYVLELGRALRPGARYIGTWYLIEDDDRRHAADLPPQVHRLSEMTELLATAGIEIATIERGDWDGACAARLSQDLVVGHRTGKS